MLLLHLTRTKKQSWNELFKWSVIKAVSEEELRQLVAYLEETGKARTTTSGHIVFCERTVPCRRTNYGLESHLKCLGEE